VVINNLPVHKEVGVHNILEKAGVQLCHLPPRLPDLDPIETASAKLRTLILRAAERTIDRFEQQLGKGFGAFSEIEFANDFRHAACAQN
jgi:hypothetical protein